MKSFMLDFLGVLEDKKFLREHLIRLFSLVLLLCVES